MKYVENRIVRLEGKARHFAAMAECAVVDTHGVYTTLAHFLCGENPWGLHQDLRFSLPMCNAMQGLRIAEAAQLAIETNDTHIGLIDGDYEVLVDVLIAPRTSGKPIPPALARAILPLLQAFDHAAPNSDSFKTERMREPAEET